MTMQPGDKLVSTWAVPVDRKFRRVKLMRDSYTAYWGWECQILWETECGKSFETRAVTKDPSGAERAAIASLAREMARYPLHDEEETGPRQPEPPS